MQKPAGLRRDIALFWISCFLLFFEIMMIRWLSAEIRIFSYFNNLVLLFCFLGMGLGCALASRKGLPMLLSFVIAALLAGLVRLDAYLGPLALSNISTYLSSGMNFLIWYRGAATTVGDQVVALLLGNGLLLFVVGLITLFFVPFGQLLGRLLNDYDRPLRAYAVNLVGSLAGIWLFNALSFFSLPPVVWFVLGGLCCLVFLWRPRWQLVVAALLVALTGAALYEPPSASSWSVWSPYQKLTVFPTTATCQGQTVPLGYVILVNNVGYMQIVNYSPDLIARCSELFPLDEIPYDHYNIPYRFTNQRDEVLIVGPGAGNDVAGALRNGARHVTAVEIDPAIIEIGRQLHPEAPYDDPRVTVINDDARSYFKKTTQQYDMVVFGLLDSHTLSSSYSNVRLDNYVYTVGSFTEVRRLLKPGGVVVLLFEVSDDFIGAHIQKGLTEAFGETPEVFVVRSGLRGWGGYGFVIGDPATIESSLAADGRLREIVDDGRAYRDHWSTSSVGPSTDDWPYLYLESRSIPPLYFLIFAWLVVLAYGGIRWAVGRKERLRIDWHFFFLGAGFLLLEVQNISKLALLFGTTWTVNTIVITAVLVMGLLSNWFVIKVRVGSLTPYYIALYATLLFNFFLPLEVFSGMSAVVKGLLAGTIMALPMFFAGIIFSRSFEGAADRAGVFASNLFGAMIGGVLECLAFVLGIKALLLLTLGLYLLSMVARRRRRSVPAGPRQVL